LVIYKVYTEMHGQQNMKVTFVLNLSMEATNGRNHSFAPTYWLTIVAKCKAASDNRTSVIWGLAFVTYTIVFSPWFIFSGFHTRGTKTLLRNILIGCSEVETFYMALYH